MNILVEINYFKVIRKIIWNEQKAIEEKYQLVLSDDVIISDSEQFKFHDILDISYRSMSEEAGFMYLHTNRGLYSYHIKTNPSQFIDTYKQRKQFLD